MLKTSVVVWDIWHSRPPTPFPLSPVLQGYCSHPGSKGIVQRCLTLLFVLLLFRKRLGMGMHGARAPQEQDFVPNPLGNAREGGPSTYVPCGGHWVPPVPCSGRE